MRHLSLGLISMLFTLANASILSPQIPHDFRQQVRKQVTKTDHDIELSDEDAFAFAQLSSKWEFNNNPNDVAQWSKGEVFLSLGIVFIINKQKGRSNK